jgi:hypothetical protein
MQIYVLLSGLHLADYWPVDPSNQVVMDIVTQGFSLNVVLQEV